MGVGRGSVPARQLGILGGAVGGAGQRAGGALGGGRQGGGRGLRPGRVGGGDGARLDPLTLLSLGRVLLPAHQVPQQENPFNKFLKQVRDRTGVA